LAEVPEDRASESFAQVGYDPIGRAEVVYDISDELCSFFRRYFRNRLDFNRLGEFVDGDQNVFVATLGSTKRSYNIKTPHGEGP
jgi:hypothetical protein